MRTVKREVVSINAGKRTLLQDLCFSYSNEKGYWLETLKAKKHQSRLGSYRQIRDEFVQSGYRSRYGLQARHWKLAL